MIINLKFNNPKYKKNILFEFVFMLFFKLKKGGSEAPFIHYLCVLTPLKSVRK